MKELVNSMHKIVLDIQDYKERDFQLNEYKKNWIDYLNIKAEIWMAHNWSGIYDKNEISRKGHN